MTDSAKPALGVSCAIGAAVLLPVIDGAVKALLVHWSAPSVAFARFAISAMCLLPLAMRTPSGITGLLPNSRWLQLVRALSAVFATLLIFEGFRTLPLADCTAIVFVAPVLANFFAWWWLKEPPSRSAWLATALCFAGVLLIAQPGTSLFRAEALYPLIGAVGLASFMTLTRAVARHDHPVTTAFVGSLLGAIAFLSMLPWYGSVLLEIKHIVQITFVGLGATVANLLVATSFRHAPTHIVAPISYLGLIVAALVGYWGFGELPAPVASVGILLILIGGLWLTWTGRR